MELARNGGRLLATGYRAWLAAAARPVTTGTALGTGYREAMQHWANKLTPPRPLQRVMPEARVGPVTAAGGLGPEAAAAPTDVQVAVRLLSGIAVLFPVVAIPWLEVQQGRINSLEQEVTERNQQIYRLKQELQQAREMDSAAASGVIF
mmetsp:Transcript_99229/g.320011  ORF Transcript_99229/g.320011 Transcript_99229/m.320011 type:complete len:149 (-) Transcript_99229:130-576(-)